MSSYREAAQGYSSFSVIRDIWTYVRPYAPRFFAASLLRMTGDIAWLYPAIAMATLVDELSKGRDASLDTLYTVFALFALATIVRGISQSGHRLLGYVVGERVRIDANTAAIRHLMRLDMVWHEKEGSGNKITRIQNAVTGMNQLIRMWFDLLIEICVNFVGILYVLSTVDTTLVVITALFMVTFFPLSFILGRRAALASLDVNKQGEEVGGVLYEAAANVRTVKILSLANSIVERVRATSAELMEKIHVRIFRYQTKNVVLFMWASAFLLGTLVYIIFGVVEGVYTVGVFVLFNRFFGQLWESVNELAQFSQEFMSSKLALARLNEMLTTEPTIDVRGTLAFPDTWQSIRFENVSFSYGGGSVLSNINLTIRRGEKIGIVGSSGAGKSTLFKLLLKERAEYQGEIYVDEVSLRDITRESYFTRVSAVLQETEVFNLTLKENVTIAAQTEKPESVFEGALRTAHVTDFAANLKNGVHTVIGERGVKLSGGERQRLGIARAIYKEPQLLLMDEATSHLDSESEEKIQDSLSKFFEQVTAIVIAHRLSTIKAMDRILVIEGGTIVEEGSFTKLRRAKGRFHELWEKQKL